MLLVSLTLEKWSNSGRDCFSTAFQLSTVLSFYLEKRIQLFEKMMVFWKGLGGPLKSIKKYFELVAGRKYILLDG